MEGSDSNDSNADGYAPSACRDIALSSDGQIIKS